MHKRLDGSVHPAPTWMTEDAEGMEDGGFNLQHMWQKAQTSFKGQV